MVPAVTVDQMREIDRLMVEAVGITLLQMMENTGRAFARLGSRVGPLFGRPDIVPA